MKPDQSLGYPPRQLGILGHFLASCQCTLSLISIIIVLLLLIFRRKVTVFLDDDAQCVLSGQEGREAVNGVSSTTSIFKGSSTTTIASISILQLVTTMNIFNDLVDVITIFTNLVDGQVDRAVHWMNVDRCCC